MGIFDRLWRRKKMSEKKKDVREDAEVASAKSKELGNADQEASAPLKAKIEGEIAIAGACCEICKRVFTGQVGGCECPRCYSKLPQMSDANVLARFCSSCLGISPEMYMLIYKLCPQCGEKLVYAVLPYTEENIEEMLKKINNKLYSNKKVKIASNGKIKLIDSYDLKNSAAEPSKVSCVNSDSLSSADLDKLKAEKDIESLIVALKNISRNDANYKKIILSIKELNSVTDEVVLELLSRLDDIRERIRAESIDGLLLIRNHISESLTKKIQDALIDKVNDPYWLARSNAISTLKAYGLPKDEFIPILSRLIRDPEATPRRSAISALSAFSVEAIPLLVEALEDNEEFYYDAPYAFGPECLKKYLVEEKAKTAIAPAIRYLINIINAAKILKGAESYDKKVCVAVSTLSYIGDASAIPALEKLLTKVHNKIKVEGMVREFVNTGLYAGYISPNDQIFSINSAISEIKSRRL